MKNNFKKIPLILSIILFVFFLLAFIFLYQKINSNNQKLQQDMSSLQSESLKRDAIEKLERSLQSVADYRASLDTHFAKSSDVVPLLDTVEKLSGVAGAQSEVNLINVSPEGTKLLIDLKASGSFEAVYKFLALLENSPYELEFLSMDMHSAAGDSSGKSPGSSKWEANLKIQLLSFLP
jgi:hypothetical protein